MRSVLRKYYLLLVCAISLFTANNSLQAQNVLDQAGLTSATPAAAAYSTRKLSSSYTGAAVRIRRQSDNAVADLAFDLNGNISANSLATFVSGGTGSVTLGSFAAATNAYVTIWYDQSGYGRNATQATAANQPLLVSNGVLVTSTVLNSKATLSFNGSSQFMDLPMSSSIINAAGTIAAVQVQPVLQSGFNAVVAWSLSGGTQGPGFGPLNIPGAFGLYTTWGPNNITLGPVAINQAYVVNATWSGNGSTVVQSRNGTIVNGSLGASFNYTGNALIGRDVGAFYNGNLAELIVSNTTITAANRTAMETNQNNAYVNAGALNFDGSNDYVNLGNILGASYTKEAWVNISNAAAVNNFISGGAASKHAFWAPNAYGNKLSAGHNEIWNQVQDPIALVAGQWYHVAVTYDAATTTMKLYKNGVLVSSNNAVPAYGGGGNVVLLGAYDLSTNLLSGSLDETRIWSRVLCQTEIQNNMNAMLSGTQTGLTAYYKFNQGITGANNTAITTVTDASGNNRNGTMVGFNNTGTTSNWVAGLLSPTAVSPVFTNPPSVITGASSICVNGSTTLTNASTGIWSSNNTAVATVNASGLVTGVSAGSAVISFTNICGAVSTKLITVSAIPTISITNPTPSVNLGNSATLTVSSNLGKAIQFNGTNSVEMNTGVVLPNTFTQEAWIYSTSGADNAYHGFLGNTAVSTNAGLRSACMYVFNGNTLHGGFGDGTQFYYYITQPGVITPNTWYHVAQTFDGTVLKCFVNGVQVPLASVVNNPAGKTPVATPVKTLGKLDNNFIGTIDEVRMWNVARSQSQLQADMNKGVPVNSTGLVAYWKLDEGTGTSTYDIKQETVGSFVGAPVWVASTAPIGGSFTWTPTTSLNNSNTASVIATPTATTTYTATATDGTFGCVVAGTTTVTVFNQPATALALDGANDYVKVKDTASLDFGANDFTIETWTLKQANTASYSNSGLVGKWNTGAVLGTNEWILNNTAAGMDNKPAFWIESGNTIHQLNGNTMMNLNQWYHLAVVRKGTLLSLYVNGVLDASISIPVGTVLNNVGRDLLIGAYSLNAGNPTIFSSAKLDELRIWNRALCLSEITNNRNGELTGTQNGLVAYYKFNQGFIGGNNVGITTLTDASGNNYHGTLFNFASNATGNWVAGNVTGNSPAFVPTTAPITGTATACVGATSTLANVNPGTWSSSNPSIATVNASGVVTAIADGTTTITFTNACAGVSTISFKVKTLPKPTIQNAGPLTFCEGESVNLTAQYGGNALSFNGSNRVTVSNTPTIPVGNSTYTMEAWIKPNNVTGANGLIGWGTWGSTNQVNALRFNGPTTLINYWWANDLYVTIPNVLDGKWHHVATTYNGTTRAIYFDGVLMGSDQPSGHNVSSGTPLYIAETYPAGNEYFNGSMDEVRIWNTGKTQAQIQASMNATVPVNSTGLVAYYKLDETSGLTAADATGNGNNGSLTGNPVWMVPSTSILGGSIQSVLWNPGGATTNSISVNSAASYTATITDNNGCTATSAPVVVTVNPKPTASISTASPLTVCLGGTVLLDASTNSNDATYQWFRNGTPIPNATNASLNAIVSGSYTVVVANANGCVSNPSNAVQVTIEDIIKPFFSAAGSITTTTNAQGQVLATSALGAVVTYNAPVGADNCSVVSNVLTAGFASGSVFPIGTTTVTYTVTDGAGLTETSSFTVTVTGLAPVIVVPANSTLNTTTGICTAIATFTATETTGIPASNITYTENGQPINSGATLSVGTHTITATATNAIGASTKTFTITVVDAQVPTVITKDVTVYLNAQGIANITTADINYGSTDNCGIASMSVSPNSFNCADLTTGNGNAVMAYTGATPNGIQNWGGTLGMDFNVVNPTGIVISQLGAFDHGQNGIIGTQAGGSIRVAVFNRNTQTIVPGLDVYIAGSSDPLVNFHRMRNITPVTLPVGNYSIVALGYNNSELNGNSGFPGYPATNTNSNSGAIVFTGGARAGSTLFDFPGSADGGPASRYHAGTFSYSTGNPGKTVVLSVVDSYGNTGTATAKVTVLDTLKPTIVAPANISVIATSAAGAMVTYVAPVGTDNCSATTAMTAGFASGSVFPIGVTTVTYKVTDASGNTDSASFTVTVSGLAPVIVAPTNLNLGAYPNCSAVANFAATETTGIPASTITYTENGLPIVSGATLSVGVHTITATATNAVGSSSATFIIRVLDTTPPQFIGFSNPVVNTDENACSAIVNIATPNVIDNCTVISIVGTRSDQLPLSAAYPLGVTTINWSARDASNNTTYIRQTITVEDNQAPTITCPSNVVVNATNAAGAIVNYTAPVGTDNCTATTVITAGFASGSVFPIGVTTVTYKVTDASGNSAACIFTVTVNAVAPVVVVPANITVNVDENTCGAAVSFAATDNTGIPASTITYTENGQPVVSGATFSTGVHTITATATNVVGSSSASFTITVIDNQAPLITAPANISVIATSAAGAIVTYVAPVGTDNCAVTTVMTAGLASGSTFPIGVTTVTYTATDASGNTASASFTVTVVGIAPVIVVPENILQNNDAGQCGASVSIAATETTAIPASTIVYTENGQTIVSGHYFTLGVHTITATATNAVGSSTATFTITVVDTDAPTFNVAIPADVTVECNAVPAAAVLTAIDNCSAVVTMTEVRTDGNSVNNYTLTRTWTATDPSGNTTVRKQVITVRDTQAPSLTVPANISVFTDNNVCGAAVSFAATAMDNCSPASISYSHNPGTVFPVGITTVTVTATDPSGNATVQTFTVSVTDKQAPLAIAKNITVGLSAVGGTVSITAADVNNGSSDACGIASMTVMPSSFSCANVGANTVTLTVTDVNGNVSATTAIVTVVDDKGPVPTAVLPVISGQCSVKLELVSRIHQDGDGCNSNDRERYHRNTKGKGHDKDRDGRDDHDGDDDEHENNGAIQIVAPTAMDNCSGLIKGTTTDPLLYNNQGTYIIHWKFVDARGNVTIQEQTVIVKDTQAPRPKYASLPTITGQCSVSLVNTNNSDDDGDHEGRRDGDDHDGDDDHDRYNEHQMGAPWAKDNCSGWVRGTTTDPLTYSVQGTYIIHWTYNDGHGNISTQNQTVIVKDITKPKIKAPNDKTVTCGSNTAPAVMGMATATDNCSVPVITYTDVNSGNQIVRTWKATDAAGNSSTAVQTIKLSTAFSGSVVSVPTSNVYTGGEAKNLYLGYGAQSTALTVTSLPSSGAPYTYSWSGVATNRLSATNTGAPVFSPTAGGVYTFTVTMTNKNGCSNTASISICVTDIRVPGSNGALVYVCHKGSGKTGGTKTLQVPVSQVASHIQSNTCGGKNDRLGSCDQNPCNSGNDRSEVDPKQLEEPIEVKPDVKTAAAPVVEELKVVVMPNPTTTYFTIRLESKDKAPVNLRVMDGSGRVIDAKQQMEPNSSFQMGHGYSSGTYYAEFIQGNKRKVIQLIKGRG